MPVLSRLAAATDGALRGTFLEVVGTSVGGVSLAHNPQASAVWIAGPTGGNISPQGRPKDYARALTACSMRSIPFSMFFMDMA